MLSEARSFEEAPAKSKHPYPRERFLRAEILRLHPPCASARQISLRRTRNLRCETGKDRLKLKPAQAFADESGMPMRRGLIVSFLAAAFLGCGGQPAPPPAGFVNQTRHSDAFLWAVWRNAQRSLARQVDLNPLQSSANNGSAVILPGDSRALSVEPQELTVSPQADVSSQALSAATGTLRPDPTGMIACPQPCDARYAPAYSLYRPELTRYAASWEAIESDFDTILEYEFENQILFALGYDMRWR